MTSIAILQMPDPDDLSAIAIHQEAVLRTFDLVFSNVDEALSTALPKVKTLFDLWEGHVDLAVHAPNVRYLAKQFLTARAITAREEDTTSFHMQRVSNCGLCIESGLSQMRVLKATPAGLPKATSEARTSFVEKNQQLSFRFGVVDPEPLLQNLGLFIIWRMDKDYKYIGMEIACPRRTRDDGSIECYWIVAFKRKVVAQASKPTLVAEKSSDLGIKKRKQRQSVNEQDK